MNMAYTKAREALRIAKDKYDMSYQDIADLCEVSLGSVKRWMLNGRANEKAIHPLIERIGQVYLSISQVADHLEQLYRAGPRENAKGHKVSRIRLGADQLERIAGRQHLKVSFKNDLIEELRERGFLLEEGTGDFVLVSWKWLYVSCSELDDSEIPEFYEAIALEMDDDEED
jgi:transcriptional regulator with XRE-family HTH domain